MRERAPCALVVVSHAKLEVHALHLTLDVTTVKTFTTLAACALNLSQIPNLTTKIPSNNNITTLYEDRDSRLSSKRIGSITLTITLTTTLTTIPLLMLPLPSPNPQLTNGYQLVLTKLKTLHQNDIQHLHRQEMSTSSSQSKRIQSM